ncbi:MAG: NBR1-Ig-like domain-containing protein [Rubrivivax sp.]
MNALGRFLRTRASELRMTLAEVARLAGVSRQTLYSMSRTGQLPEMQSLVNLSTALEVHPLKLMQLVFEDYPLPVRTQNRQRQRGDQTIFLQDVTIPDGALVMAGSRFTKVWEVQNVGTEAWVDRYLACMDDQIDVRAVHSGERMPVIAQLVPVERRIAVPSTPPGAVVRLAVEFVAPAIPATCVSYWKSVYADGSLCFPEAVGLSCLVRVVTMTPTELAAKQAPPTSRAPV